MDLLKNSSSSLSGILLTSSIIKQYDNENTLQAIPLFLKDEVFYNEHNVMNGYKNE